MIAARYAEVRARIDRACERAGRDPGEVDVVAVTKKFPASTVAAAYAAGIRDVGESYAQELVAKKAEVGAKDGLRWHFIGHLQRNKAKAVVGEAALIHAVDSVRLGREIDKRAAAAGLVQPVLVAVNVAGEAHKSGVAPDAVAELLAALAELPALRCDGFMTMPPLADDPEDSRRYFRAVRELRDRLRSSAAPLDTLSLGTTGDFEVAVEEGATLVRVGTAIFGPRSANRFA